MNAEMERLISAASAPLSDADHTALGWPGTDGLLLLLARKNGFYAFESALHVFPAAPAGAPGRSLAEWNAPGLWKAAYGDLAPTGVCFAEDVFGGQFVLGPDGTVDRFDPEAAATTTIAGSVTEWVALVLADYDYETGFPVAHDWQIGHGALRPGHRLLARVPFILGGEYAAVNMVGADAAVAMTYRAGLAHQTATVPDGGQINWDISVVDTLAT
jgi:hypothetical protein